MLIREGGTFPPPNFVVIISAWRTEVFSFPLLILKEKSESKCQRVESQPAEMARYVPFPIYDTAKHFYH